MSGPVRAVPLSVIVGVPLVVDVLGDVVCEADVVLLQEGEVEELSLEVVSVGVGIVRAVSQERQLYVLLGEVTVVETPTLVERILQEVASRVTEY